jgi:hypothetical protein
MCFPFTFLHETSRRFLSLPLACCYFSICVNHFIEVHNLSLFCLKQQVVIPHTQLRSVNPSTSRTNASEKYIQVVSVDNHEFWFMGFVYYDSAVKNLQEALQEAQNLRA